jgi:hypothetical protein
MRPARAGDFSARAQFVVVRVTTPLVLLGGIGLVGYAVVAIVLGDAAPSNGVEPPPCPGRPAS